MPSNLPKGDKLCRLRLTCVMGAALVVIACLIFAPVTVMFALSPPTSNSSKLVAGVGQNAETLGSSLSTEDVSLSLEEVGAINARTKLSLHVGTGVGLYSSGEQILELRGHEVEPALRGGQEMVIAFYAPWCGHCRHLVKPYSALAVEVQVKRNVTFCAVNCDSERKTCEKHKVRAYPTIVAFNFASDAQQTAPPNGFSIKSGIKGVREYVNKKASLYEGSNTDLRQSKLRGTNAVSTLYGHGFTKSTTGPVDIENWVTKVLNGRGRAVNLPLSVSPLQRLEDGLTSLEYLLLHELSVAVAAAVGTDTAAVKATSRFLKVLLPLLPLEEESPVFQKRVCGLQNALTYLESFGGTSPTSERKAYAAAMQKALNTNIQYQEQAWTVCGLLVSDSSASTTDSAAYPCGLWLLMHFMTVATSSETFRQDCALHKLRHDLCVHDVAHTFRELIQQTFRCGECAGHFVAAYDQCLFGRPGCKDVKGTLLEREASASMKLQLWLFHLHNNVTMRVYRAQYSSEHGQELMGNRNPPRTEAEITWPFGSNTPMQASQIIDILRQAYISPTWTSLAPLLR